MCVCAACALGWCTYLLLTHPEILQRVVEEVSAVGEEYADVQVGVCVCAVCESALFLIFCVCLRCVFA